MYKQSYSAIAVFLSAMATLLACLLWAIDHSRNGAALAAPHQATPTSLPLANNLPNLQDETVPSDSALAERTVSRGWQIECVDCPKYFSNMTDRSLHLDMAGEDFYRCIDHRGIAAKLK